MFAQLNEGTWVNPDHVVSVIQEWSGAEVVVTLDTAEEIRLDPSLFSPRGVILILGGIDHERQVSGNS